MPALAAVADQAADGTHSNFERSVLDVGHLDSVLDQQVRSAEVVTDMVSAKADRFVLLLVAKVADQIR